jgi:hypothetical protein
MPELVIGGVTVNVQDFSRLADEQGGGDWAARNWSTKAVLATDAEVSTLRTALQSTTPRDYVRMLNGSLRRGPIITCSGDRLGGTVACGVEIGEQPLEVTAPVRSIFHHTLSLTLREAL